MHLHRLERYWNEDGTGGTHHPPAAGALDSGRAGTGWGQTSSKQGWVEMEGGQVS